jgi:hypothetical protein
VRTAGGALRGADDDETVRACVGEDSERVVTCGAGGVHLMGRRSGDLGHEQGRTGAYGGGDKHGAQLNAASRSA